MPARKTNTLNETAASFKVKPVTGGSLAGAIEEARELADGAKTLDDLRKTVEGFNGCAFEKNCQ